MYFYSNIDAVYFKLSEILYRIATGVFSYNLKHFRTSKKVQIISAIFVAYYNRWNQSINWSSIEILIKINREKTLKLKNFEGPVGQDKTGPKGQYNMTKLARRASALEPNWPFGKSELNSKTKLQIEARHRSKRSKNYMSSSFFFEKIDVVQLVVRPL